MQLITFANYKNKSNVEKAKKGDKEAFLSLINENRLTIYRVAKGILKEEADVEDVIQNTVIKALENIKTLKKDEFFKTWLIRILINECNNIIRKYKKHSELDGIMMDEKSYDSYEDIDLTNGISSLSEELRVVTVLYYFEDYSTVEISKFLNIPEGTVRSRLTRARGRLREFMGAVE